VEKFLQPAPPIQGCFHAHPVPRACALSLLFRAFSAPDNSP
jgi:hypothetical protein